MHKYGLLADAYGIRTTLDDIKPACQISITQLDMHHLEPSKEAISNNVASAAPRLSKEKLGFAHTRDVKYP